jgi:hypothetical protein
MCPISGTDAPLFTGGKKMITQLRIAFASTALLAVGLLLPDRLAVAPIGIGLVGLLALRLFAADPRRSPRPTVSSLTVDRRDPADMTVTPSHRSYSSRGIATGWHSALVDDVLDDSFPASDPPSWNSFRSGPPAVRLPAAAQSVLA